MSPSGATSSPDDRAQGSRHPADRFFLPNFCDPRIVLGVVLLAELLALTFSFVRPAGADFLTELARLSVLIQWLALTSAGLVCVLRAPLRRLSTPLATSAVLGIVLANILLLSAVVVWLGRWLGDGGALGFFPASVFPFAARNLGVGLIVTALVLRYLFVTHQWRAHIESEARSRIDALQARIRPHFLFNSMNTIASLTRSDPKRAEEAVEDLADLFRVTLSDAGRLLTLKEELELSRIYQRIEMLRLGDRLRVVWDVAELPMRARVPALTIQPLLENAIYHGIEPLDQGGTVRIHGALRGQDIEISVSNPVQPAARAGHEGGAAAGRAAGAAAAGGQRDDSTRAAPQRRGNQIAVDNIRERLALAFDGRGGLAVEQSDGEYRVRVHFPLQQ